MKLITIAVSVSTLLLAGCTAVPVIKSSTEELATIKGKPLTIVTYKKPDFATFTAGKAVFGLLGAVAMITEGNKIISENSIADPADTIISKLKPVLSEKMGNSLVTDTISTDDNIENLAAIAKKNGLVLDVKTINWRFNYFPNNWTHYRVTYAVRARLIDATANRVLAQIPCTYVSDNENTASTYDELLNNKAALLKSKLAKAADECTKLISKNMLNVELGTITTAQTPQAEASDPAATPVAASPRDMNRVPFINAEGQAKYQEFLNDPTPKAFAIADNGQYAKAYGTTPRNRRKPKDPKERALLNCQQAAKKECTLYAVDNDIVYQK